MFGFLRSRKIIPASEPERLVLVRRLMKIRFDHDPEIRAAFAAMDIRIKDFDNTMLLSSPEASVMRIVEQYTTVKEQGASDDIIIPFLNQSHTVALSMAGQELPPMSPPYSIERYLAHLLGHVHSHGHGVAPGFIPLGIREVRAFYGR